MLRPASKCGIGAPRKPAPLAKVRTSP